MPDADVVAEVLADTWELFASAIPQARLRREQDLISLTTGIEVPALNGVWTVGSVPADLRLVAAMLDELDSSGLPHCLQSRPGAGDDVGTLAQERGMQADDDIPLMVLDDPARLRDAQAVDGLVIRRARPADDDALAAVWVEGFGGPPEQILGLTRQMDSMPESSAYLGEVDGKPVCASAATATGESVGIFNVVTLPSRRGHGYASAVTARAVTDAMSADARWAWLQSSTAGFGVYERLGFRTLETWRCWATST